jgi:hypothetical protein
MTAQMNKSTAILIISLTFLLCSFESHAQEQNHKPGGGDVSAAAANDPSIPIVQIQMQDWFNPTYDGVRGQGNQFLFRPIVPFDSNGFVPSSIVRLAVPVLSEPNGRTGLGDTQFIALFFLVGTTETK